LDLNLLPIQFDNTNSQLNFEFKVEIRKDFDDFNEFGQLAQCDFEVMNYKSNYIFILNCFLKTSKILNFKSFDISFNLNS